jgi:hypothetical protein
LCILGRTFLPERIPGSCVMYLGRAFQSEGDMEGFYLGIAVTGINALVAMGLVIVLM